MTLNPWDLINIQQEKKTSSTDLFSVREKIIRTSTQQENLMKCDLSEGS